MQSLARSVLLSALANTGSLALAAWLLDGFTVTLGWFVAAVVLFTALSVALRRATGSMAPRLVRSSAVVAGLVLTAAALALTAAVVPHRGFDLDGPFAWIVATLLVWAASVAYGEVDAQAPSDAPPVTPR